MFEKVNAGHPDKMADRLAGAVVDLVYGFNGLRATIWPLSFMYNNYKLKELWKYNLSL